MRWLSRWWGEFTGFALKGNVLELAVAVVLGGAFQGVVDGLVTHIIMPTLSYVTPGADSYASWKIGRVEVGGFLASVVNFALIALAMFLVIRKVVGSIRKAVDPPDPSGPTTKECPYCLSKIPDPATRCAYCTADLPAPPASPKGRSPSRGSGRKSKP
ncbi:large conductance mechanosensitive channel protein MscL [Tautonia plasticadhaerens]|uniref:Large-conductance mechanosensitive channel n=1 Tax=Tautonia plasticadhaerens TaxID=2527974 RepID=A0A518H7M5_9BACT|nr:large conductance mechanosensitive channel protein MscL [Tautonia plasticadhaerens]QDV36825.1 Large-conductance mechanosensitive channel [Tautonia plasticadhaerens]